MSPLVKEIANFRAIFLLVAGTPLIFRFFTIKIEGGKMVYANKSSVK